MSSWRKWKKNLVFVRHVQNPAVTLRCNSNFTGVNYVWDTNISHYFSHVSIVLKLFTTHKMQFLIFFITISIKCISDIFMMMHKFSLKFSTGKFEVLLWNKFCLSHLTKICTIFHVTKFSSLITHKSFL